VQKLIPLRPKRAELKLTTAHYYLPSGRSLHRDNGSKEWGVDPDVSVPVSIRQTNRYAEIRQETDLLKEVDPAKQASLLAQQLQDDLELQTALLLARLDVLTHQ
jgi:C-terminal processing protease CtpA/Prc